MSLYYLHLTREQEGVAVVWQEAGKTASPSRLVTPMRLHGLHFVTDLYRQHTRAPAPADLTQAALVALGVEMFNLWLADTWPTPHGPCQLTIVSQALDLLLLPWEVVLPPEGTFIGVDPNWTVVRQSQPMASQPQLTNPNLVFFQSQPNDRPPLEAPWQPASPLPGPVTCSGTLAAWHDTLSRASSCLLFLHGHALVRGSNGYFAFCEEQGESHIVTASELSHGLRAYPQVQGIILCGREENHPPPAGAMHALGRQLAATLPVVVWPDAPLAPHCHPLLTALIQALSQPNPLSDAVAQARRQEHAREGSQNYPAWSLLASYAPLTHGYESPARG